MAKIDHEKIIADYKAVAPKWASVVYCDGWYTVVTRILTKSYRVGEMVAMIERLKSAKAALAEKEAEHEV